MNVKTYEINLEEGITKEEINNLLSLYFSACSAEFVDFLSICSVAFLLLLLLLRLL